MLTKKQYAKAMAKYKLTSRELDAMYFIYTLKHAKVEMYFKPNCIYCQKAKQFLHAYHIPFMSYNVGDPTLLNQMSQRTNPFGLWKNRTLDRSTARISRHPASHFHNFHD